MAISVVKGYNVTIISYEDVDIWDKRLKIYHYFDKTRDAIFIKSQNHICPKCNTVFVGEIKHLTTLQCHACGAEYHFAGAMLPEVIGATREEVEIVLRQI